jgi:hypothetical protein
MTGSGQVDAASNFLLSGASSNILASEGRWSAL